MLKGKELGEAIRQALADNGKTAADAARYFNVKPPSVSGWLSTGRISKDNFDRLRVWLSKTPDAYWGAGAKPVGVASVASESLPVFGDQWPFSPDLLAQVLDLNDRERLQLEGAMRLALAQIRPQEGRKQTAA